LYTKDLLLNAEWNKPEDRKANLHRHPTFFGYAEDIIHDCCGFCPNPTTPEEHDLAEEDAKIYVSGEISFIKDDPGRQAIGSFNPITSDGWTEMAYVGNTAQLCQAIIDSNLEHVQDWISQEGSDPNSRDYAGRTPLRLAVMVSSPEIVQTFIDHGARLVARLADGRTALHLAAARGNVEIVKMIMQKSKANEEEEEHKEELRKKARMIARQRKRATINIDKQDKTADDDGSDFEVIDHRESDSDMRSTTTGSYIKVNEEEKKADDLMPEDKDGPDFYDVNVLAWDTQCSPLHLAILNGHVDVVKELVQNCGANVLLPIKLLNSWNKFPRGAILTLVLSLRLPLEKAKLMTRTLLDIGASSTQADTCQVTALHYISVEQPELVETLLRFNEPIAKRAMNHLSVCGSSWNPSAQSPLMSATAKGNVLAALKLLDAGAEPSIEFKDWMKSVEKQFTDVAMRDSTRNRNDFLKDIEQPIVLAVQNELPDLALALLARGVDPNTLPRHTQQGIIDHYYSQYNMETVLEMVRNKIRELRSLEDEEPPALDEKLMKDNVNYLEGIESDSYKEFVAKIQIEDAYQADRRANERYEERLKQYNNRKGFAEKKQTTEALAERFEAIERKLIKRGAKTFLELHPDKSFPKHQNQQYSYEERKPTPLEISFDFSVHNLTDETKEAYLELFQAGWEGDLNKIKTYTLASWGPKADNTPLKITVEDKHDQSPFSLAVLRGHFEVARAIVDISFAQYHPDQEKPRARYRIGHATEEYDDDCEDEDAASDTTNIPVYEELLDDCFTIDNIGEVSTQVKSKTSPLAFIHFPCSAWSYAKFFRPDLKPTYGLEDKEVEGSGTKRLSSWAVAINDMKLFSFILDLDLVWTNRLADPEDGSSPILSISNDDFQKAIQYARLDILAEMIKHAGAGMEPEFLVKNSSVKYREKPKYYQGLSARIP
ncbi:ankyrin, partial [Lojkania enalia]